MVIGQQFAWAHLPKTGGDATLALFNLFPDLIIAADESDTNSKHRSFRAQEKETTGKLLGLNIRRLPSWMLSYMQHRARRGLYPDYKPLPMPSPDEIAESAIADRHLKVYTNNGNLKIDRWLRTEYLKWDFLTFMSEFVEVSDDKKLKVLNVKMINANSYMNDVKLYFTKDQIEKMYANNPLWASIEQEVYKSEVNLEIEKNKVILLVRCIDTPPNFAESVTAKALHAGNSSSNLEAEDPLYKRAFPVVRHPYLSGLLDHREQFEGVEVALGFFDSIIHAEHRLLVAGWLLLPDKNLNSFRVFINGKWVGSTEIEVREDIGKAFPWLPHAKQSGFRLHLQIDEIEKVERIDVLAYQEGRPTARINTFFRADLDAAVPTPPAELMAKVAATRNAHFFKLEGGRVFGNIFHAIKRHGNLNTVRRVLDWECGCGRLTAHFLLESNNTEIHGCDSDPVSIAWCREHLRLGHFSCIEPLPPTPYKDAMFDLVIAHSVFTHLSVEAQNVWLAEMKRIIAPGGLLLAFVNSLLSASYRYPTTFNAMLHGLLQHGIFYQAPTSFPKDVISESYHYQYVVQTPEYTFREWSKHFEIVEYVERSIGNCQDLVVMRRPA